ncbi:hypothetical protein MTO96_049374 [Rhipicephalus appendiculatus]
MLEVRSDASAAAACGRIYIAGGFHGFLDSGQHRVLRPVDECLDQELPPWHLPAAALKVVAHKDMLYIIGGNNGVVRLSSMEQFDIRRARSSELPSMPHGKSNFAAVVLDGCIYTIGGFNGTTTVRLVEGYDIATRKWFTAPQIPINCSASAACVVQDVADPAPWI